MTLSGLDVAFLVLIIIVIVKATLSGFVADFFSKAAVIIGTMGAVLFYRKLLPYIIKYVSPEIFPEAISFLVIFLVLYLAVKAVQQIAGSAFQSESMTNLDRALGFFLGIAEGFLVVAVILIAMRLQPWIDLSFLTRNSLFARIFEPLLAGDSGFINGLGAFQFK